MRRWLITARWWWRVRSFTSGPLYVAQLIYHISTTVFFAFEALRIIPMRPFLFLLLNVGNVFGLYVSRRRLKWALAISEIYGAEHNAP